MKFIATTAYGLEGALSREMKALDFKHIEVDTSRVTFEGDLADGCRANLMLRSAGRVRIEVGSIKAETFDELHDGVYAMPWEDFVERGFTVTVTARSVRSKLHAEPSIQSVAHKAICRRLCEKYKVSKLVGKSKYAIEVHLYKDRAVLSLDTSGQPLHMRGYRVLNPEAALRETLAGALVTFSGWRYDWPMVDPFCGSGTICVEAAMAARNMPPGGNREFIGEKFRWWDKAIWEQQREKALDEINWEPLPPIRGFDNDPKVLSMAKTHARKASVSEDITWAEADATTMQLEEERGHILFYLD